MNDSRGRARKKNAVSGKVRPMKKVMPGMTKTVGLAPGTLLHTGERKTGDQRITVFAYDEQHEFHSAAVSMEEYAALRERFRVLWINIDGLHDVSVIEEAGRIFGIHSLTLEDILQTG
ncbi:MAG: magnesium and cobalt transport protein CorA, partial [Chlorobiaceae bacterium]|nr:magnesium and cobalt transport protein CorA [Chlorobiaceae bacterium]